MAAAADDDDDDVNRGIVLFPSSSFIMIKTRNTPVDEGVTNE